MIIKFLSVPTLYLGVMGYLSYLPLSTGWVNPYTILVKYLMKNIMTPKFYEPKQYDGFKPYEHIDSSGDYSNTYYDRQYPSITIE